MSKKKVTEQVIKARVDRVTRLLDKDEPDWYKKIRVSKLDFMTHDQCALGQIYGDVAIGVQKLELESRHSQHRGIAAWPFYGIEVDGDTATEEFDNEHKLLCQAWGAAAKERREKHKKVVAA